MGELRTMMGNLAGLPVSRSKGGGRFFGRVGLGGVWIISDPGDGGPEDDPEPEDEV